MTTSKINEHDLDENLIKKLEYLKNYVTPEMYGAVGDGVSDDTVAIQTAIDSAGADKIVYLGAKTYKISTGLVFNTLYANAKKNYVVNNNEVSYIRYLVFFIYIDF